MVFDIKPYIWLSSNIWSMGTAKDQCSETYPSNDYKNPGVIFKNHFFQRVADSNQSNNACHHVKQVDWISQKVVKSIIGSFDCQYANDCNTDQDQWNYYHCKNHY